MELTEKTEGCKCQWCVWHHKFKQHLANVPEESKAFFNEMCDELVQIQEDFSISEAVIDGSWPSADDVISFRRKKLAEKKAQKLLEAQVKELEHKE